MAGSSMRVPRAFVSMVGTDRQDEQPRVSKGSDTMRGALALLGPTGASWSPAVGEGV